MLSLRKLGSNDKIATFSVEKWMDVNWFPVRLMYSNLIQDKIVCMFY